LDGAYLPRRSVILLEEDTRERAADGVGVGGRVGMGSISGDVVIRIAVNPFYGVAVGLSAEGRDGNGFIGRGCLLKGCVMPGNRSFRLL